MPDNATSPHVSPAPLYALSPDPCTFVPLTQPLSCNIYGGSVIGSMPGMEANSVG